MKLFKLLAENVSTTPFSNITVSTPEAGHEKFLESINNIDLQYAPILFEAKIEDTAYNRMEIMRTNTDKVVDFSKCVKDHASYMKAHINESLDDLKDIRKTVLIRGISENSNSISEFVELNSDCLRGFDCLRFVKEQTSLGTNYISNPAKNIEIFRSINEKLEVREEDFERRLNTTSVTVENAIASIDKYIEIYESLYNNIDEYMENVDGYARSVCEMTLKYEMSQSDEILESQEANNKLARGILENTLDYTYYQMIYTNNHCTEDMASIAKSLSK